MRSGILIFRFQNQDGTESEVDFPAGPNDPINALPAAFSHDQVTHVTMQVLAAGGFTRGLITAFFWGRAAMEITSSPGMPEPEETITIAVYDPHTGKVVHQHHTVRFPGAPKRSRAEHEKRAVELARSQTGFQGPLAVLEVHKDDFDQPGHHTIDPETLKLRTKAFEPFPRTY